MHVWWSKSAGYPVPSFGTSRARSNSQVRATPPSWHASDPNRSKSIQHIDGDPRSPSEHLCNLIFQFWCKPSVYANTAIYAYHENHDISFPSFFVAVIRVMVASDRACSGMPKTLCFLDCQVHSRSMLCQLVVSTYLRISDQVENCPRKGQESKNCYISGNHHLDPLIVIDRSTFPWLFPLSIPSQGTTVNYTKVTKVYKSGEKFGGTQT